MNILIPHSWLIKFLDTEAKPATIGQYLSLCGPSVERITKVNNDDVYDIEVTTNRADNMSVIGIAREAAAILPQFGIKAKLKKDIYQTTGGQVNSSSKNLPEFPLKVTVDTRICPRFTAVVINDVIVKSSPPKIQAYLENSGIRALNNIIDISNYLMRAYGQPVHTFDFDKIKERLTLRLSKKGEKITTLDNKSHLLPGSDIVIEDAGNRLIDLCGIMGGINTAVDKNTKKVLLFIQNYRPQYIRDTSMTLGQRSEAAQLFEKDLDPQLVMPVLLQGIKLFSRFAGGKQGSQIIDIYPQSYQQKKVTASLQLIKKRLGIDISKGKVNQTLKALGFETKFDKKTELFTVSIPSFRGKDINIPEDIVEEIARIYGYHQLPSQLMASAIPTNYPNEHFNLEYQIKVWLADLGLNEIYTNSMVSESLAKDSQIAINSHLKIKNALSEDWQYLRRSIIPSHLEAIKQNPHIKNLTFFEIAHTYQPRPNSLPEEKLELVITTKKNFSFLKGVVELLFEKLHLLPKFVPLKSENNQFVSGKTAAIIINKKPLGTIGASSVNPDIATTIIDLNSVLRLAKPYPKYQPISAFPPIIEDLTFTLPSGTYLDSVIDTIKAVDKLIQSVKLTKTYHQNYTFNLTYQNPKRSLNDKIIAPIRKKIVNKLETKFKGELVGKLR